MKFNLTNMPKEYHGWLERTDDWLAEVIHRGDPIEANIAMQIIGSRYQPEFEQRLKRELPSDRIEEVLQEVYEGFFRTVRVQGIRKGVPHLIRKIEKYKRVDAIRRLVAERRIEQNRQVDLSDDEHENLIRALDVPFEQHLETNFQREFAQKIPFCKPFFSDCERVLWILNNHLDYKPGLIARLAGKSSRNVSSTLYNAREKLRKFVLSEEFDIYTATKDLDDQIWPTVFHSKSLVIERMSECMTPRLTEEELKPVGLSSQDFQNHYAVSFMLPRYFDEDSPIGEPYLVL